MTATATITFADWTTASQTTRTREFDSTEEADRWLAIQKWNLGETVISATTTRKTVQEVLAELKAEELVADHKALLAWSPTHRFITHHAPQPLAH